jgi:nucleotide sugar dehydrogenase
MDRSAMISKSPYGENFEYQLDINSENKKIDEFIDDRKTVVVQGLGFVGSAMVAALANAKNKKNDAVYNVIGVDLPDERNYWKIAMVKNGKPPVLSPDNDLEIAFHDAFNKGNLLATYSEYAYFKADIVVIDIHLDINKKKHGNPYEYDFTYDNFKQSIEIVAKNISENTLVIIETTVPPGTTEKIIYPVFRDAFKKRRLDIRTLYVSHSYERVMPGPNYLSSIINFYRVYSGINKKSKEKAREFFESFINTVEYPLFEMHSTAASEMAKVLENSYRAMNIAFIQEWTEYAHNAEVNLFEIIEAIRYRPTHKNIMLPGFGVGGYCLTKDSLLADWSYKNLFKGDGHLEMSLNAIRTNDLMPDYTFKLLKRETSNLRDKNITILGISYLNDIADTRHTPVKSFFDKCIDEGAIVNLHDPVVSFWDDKDLAIDTDIYHLKNKLHDIAIFTIGHQQYLDLTANDILSLFKGVKIIIDANNIINDKTAIQLSEMGIKLIGVGKGHWHHLGGSD